MVMPYHLHMPSYFLETFTEYPFIRSLELYGTPNSVLEIITRIFGWERINVYMFRRFSPAEAIVRANNLLIQYVIVLVPVECDSQWFWVILPVFRLFLYNSYS